MSEASTTPPAGGPRPPEWLRPQFTVEAPEPRSVIPTCGPDVAVYDSAEEMGWASAVNLAAEQCRLAEERDELSFIIMAAPSAFAFYRAYVQLAESSPRLRRAIRKTHFFQFDDYPLPAHHPASFRFLLLRHFFMPLATFTDPAKVHLFEADAADPDAAARRYEKAVLERGLDLQLMGIGENGHWGFHEPGIPLEGSPRFMRVALTEENIDQQMRDHPHLFRKPEDVPLSAYTASVPLFLTTRHLIEGNVPQAGKALALLAAFGSDAVCDAVPAGALKRHPQAVVRTTQAAAWALADYREKGVVTRDAANRLAESLRGPHAPDIRPLLARIRETLAAAEIRMEDFAA